MISRIGWCWVIMVVLSLIGCTADEGNREQMVDLNAVTIEDPEKQLQNLNEAIGRSKRDGSLYTRRAMVLLRKGDLEQALEDVDLAISLSKNEPANYFVKAQILYLMGRPDEAFPMALQAERNSYQSSSLYVLLAELYLHQRDYTQARNFIRQALELSPEDEYAFYYNGRILAETGDTTKALYNYRQALAQNPEFMEPHRELAGLYLARQEMSLSRQHLEKVGQLAPQDPLLWYYKGLLQLAEQRKDSAFQSFSKAVAIADTLQGAHYQLGILQHVRGDYEAAIQHLDQAQKVYGNTLRYLTVKASSYENAGENLAALRTYERVVAQEPRHSYALQSIARLRYRLERPRPRPQFDSMAVRQQGY